MTYLGTKIDRLLKNPKSEHICPVAHFLLLAAKDAQEIAEDPSTMLRYRDSMSLSSHKDKKMIRYINRFLRGI